MSLGGNYHCARLTNDDTGVENGEVRCQGRRADEQWSRGENQATWPQRPLARAVLRPSRIQRTCLRVTNPASPLASPLPAGWCPLAPKFQGQRKGAKEVHTTPYEVNS